MEIRTPMLAVALLGVLVPTPSILAAEVSVPHEFGAGERAVADEVNANFDAVASGVNDNHARIGVLEALHGDPEGAPFSLAYQLEGSDPVALLGIREGGVERTAGGTIQPAPLVALGTAGELRTLIDAFMAGSRFNGRILRVMDTTLTVLLDFRLALVRAVSVPATGAGADPFMPEIRLQADSSSAVLAPAQASTAPTPAEPVTPSMEVAVGSLGVTVDVLKSDGIEVSRTSGGVLTSTDPVVWVEESAAQPLVTAFEDGLRLADLRFTFRHPDGSAAMEVRSTYGRVLGVRPDYTGRGVRLSFRLDEPAVEAF